MQNFRNRFIAICMVLTMLLSFTGCTSETKSETVEQLSSGTQQEAQQTSATSDTKQEDKSGEEVPSQEETTTTYKDRVVIANSATLAKLDPQSNNTGVNGHIYEMTHNTLVSCDYNTNEIIPELAKSWEQPDDLTYIFHLEEGVTFHNGEPFTAKDVIYTYQRAAEQSYQAAKVQDIASMEALDDYTVKITLQRTNAELLDNFCSPNLSILCEKAITEKGDEWGAAVGTGAYELTEWMADDYTLLTRNDNYWGELPVTREIVYRKIAEPSARVIALQTGEVDICLDVPASEAGYVSEDENLRLLEIPSTKLVYIALNTNGVNPALTNEKVRQALNYATDTEGLILALKEGYASEANGVIPQGVWGYSDSVQAYTYDPEKAKALLSEAGYADGVELSLSYADSIYPGVFEVLQAQWAQVGVNLTLNTNDSTTTGDQLKDGSYDSTIAMWSFSSIDYSLRALWYSGSGSNRTLIADPTLDGMLDAAVGELDTEKRAAAYAEISQYMTDYGAMIPMYIDTLLYGENQNVEGVVYNSNIRHEFTYVAVAE